MLFRPVALKTLQTTSKKSFYKEKVDGNSHNACILVLLTSDFAIGLLFIRECGCILYLGDFDFTTATVIVGRIMAIEATTLQTELPGRMILLSSSQKYLQRYHTACGS